MLYFQYSALIRLLAIGGLLPPPAAAAAAASSSDEGLPSFHGRCLLDGVQKDVDEEEALRAGVLNAGTLLASRENLSERSFPI